MTVLSNYACLLINISAVMEAVLNEAVNNLLLRSIYYYILTVMFI